MTFRPLVSPFLWMSDPQKAFSFRGGKAPLTPEPHWGLWGLCPQTPIKGSCTALGPLHFFIQVYAYACSSNL